MSLISTGQRVKYSVKGDKVIVTLPKNLTKLSEGKALAFKFKK